MIEWSFAPQGTEEWLAARRGVITASNFKLAKDRLKSGQRSKTALAYAMDVARERAGGTAPAKFQTAAMRTGQEQEPVARMRREDEAGYLIELVGFAYTEDRKFGGSVDGLIDIEGIWECKAMVSSETLFTAMVEGDISEYVDQCDGNMWLLGRKWCDLSLWCPDLQRLHTVRIARDDDRIEALERELLDFDKLVESYASRLRQVLGRQDSPPWDTPAAPSPTSAAPVAPKAAPADLIADPFA